MDRFERLQMKITFVLFDGYTALDFIGGYEVLARLPGATANFAALETGIVASDTRRLGVVAYQKLEDITEPGILFIPGGPGARVALQNRQLLEEIRRLHKTSDWTVGVCNGVELLGKAGLLEGVTVTTNYFSRDDVTGYGANVVPERFTADGKIVTGAGVSASIDTAFFLAAKIAGESTSRALQLGIEYYPAPPFPDTKAVDEAPDFIKQIIGAFEDSDAERAMLAQPTPF
ncbi:DJ-1/PfpI family protein [Sneathiella chungangensis]|uniref:DJ-1/PfpI family protein n=1 Tax=Sneathiella chungangensis TaxID=1418234 RepID=A0A845MED0_9PROT|nr:DJ-1/PfpI family protein [Sneathiella chungangensis]MZR22338.1 DJ-1/PfpI family protein [Sneathiella chungangensis]